MSIDIQLELSAILKNPVFYYGVYKKCVKTRRVNCLQKEARPENQSLHLEQVLLS
jgi:hypothetical protein